MSLRSQIRSIIDKLEDPSNEEIQLGILSDATYDFEARGFAVDQLKNVLSAFDKVATEFPNFGNIIEAYRRGETWLPNDFAAMEYSRDVIKWFLEILGALSEGLLRDAKRKGR